MADDFNTPKALAVLFELMNEIYPKIWDLTQKQAKILRNFLRATLLGLGFGSMDYTISEEVGALVQERELSRVNKQFTHADGLRKKIEALGYSVEDTPAGPLVLPKQN